MLLFVAAGMLAVFSALNMPLQAVPGLLLMLAGAASLLMLRRTVNLLSAAPQDSSKKGGCVVMIGLMLKLPVFGVLVYWAARLGTPSLAAGIAGILSVYCLFVWDVYTTPRQETPPPHD